MTQWRITPISAGRLEEIARLHALCFPDEAWSAADFAGILAMAGTSGHLVEAFETSASSGFLFDALLGESGEIITLGVVAEMRRRGAARALLEDLFRRAQSRRISRLTLEVADDNEAALALYQGHGFMQVGVRRRYYHRADGREVDAKLLSRTLAT